MRHRLMAVVAVMPLVSACGANDSDLGDGTDPCQPPAFDGWSAGGSGPSVCADPAALTAVDQCLPGLLPPDDLDRKLHAQQLAVLATLLQKYGGKTVVVVDPRAPRT